MTSDTGREASASTFDAFSSEGEDFLSLLNRVGSEYADADPGDVQAVAASQLKLLGAFYEVALDQARKSFRGH